MLLSLSLSLSLVLACAAAPQTPAPDWQVGQPFPSFRLPDATTGEWRTDEELRGVPTLLHVYASW